MESTNSCFSLVGFVSSKRRLNLPPYSLASPAFNRMLLACPMCRYPLGSGGKRVCTVSYTPSARSLSIICSIKLREVFSSVFSALSVFTAFSSSLSLIFRISPPRSIDCNNSMVYLITRIRNTQTADAFSGVLFLKKRIPEDSLCRNSFSCVCADSKTHHHFLTGQRTAAPFPAITWQDAHRSCYSVHSAEEPMR